MPDRAFALELLECIAVLAGASDEEIPRLAAEAYDAHAGKPLDEAAAHRMAEHVQRACEACDGAVVNPKEWKLDINQLKINRDAHQSWPLEGPSAEARAEVDAILPGFRQEGPLPEEDLSQAEERYLAALRTLEPDASAGRKGRVRRWIDSRKSVRSRER